MAFSLDIRSHSEIGLVRKNNQDSGYVSPTMLVVADGMGGAAAGDLASTVAVKQVARVDSPRTGEEMLTLLAGAVSEANDELADLCVWDHSLEGMGTTFCGAMFDGAQLGLVHIGDSRGYLMRSGKLRRMTHDDSWVQSLVDEGRITEEQAAVHPHRSLLLKVLNGQPQHTPDTQLVDVELGDRILFCSDGLCGFVSDPMIRKILRDNDLDTALKLLVAEAHAAGAPDNVTVVLAEVVEYSEELAHLTPKIIGAAAITAIPEHDVTAPLPMSSRDLADAETGPTGAPGGATRAASGAGAWTAGRAGAPRYASLDDDTPLVFDSEAEESARYAPIDPESRHRWRGLVITVAIVVVAITAGVFAVRAYLDRQFYVGEQAGSVAIFRGVPDSLAWVKLSSVQEATNINVDDLPTIYRSAVDNSIQVDSLDSARATVAELRSGANRCIALRARPSTGTPGGSASPTPGASASPTPSPGAVPSGSASASTSPAGSPTPGVTASESASPATPVPTATAGASLPKVSEEDCS